MNNTPTRLTGKEPSEAIKLERVELNGNNYKGPVGFNEERLPSFSQVRYLYAPGELEGGNRRATDPNWSFKIFNLKKSLVSKDQSVLYLLSEGAPKR